MDQVTGILRHELMEFMFEDPTMLVSFYPNLMLVSFYFMLKKTMLVSFYPNLNAA